MYKHKKFNVFQLFLFILLISIFFSPQIFSQQEVSILFEDEETSKNKKINKKEIEGKTLKKEDKEKKSFRNNVYTSAVDFANWIDRFFGNEEPESASYDFLRLSNELRFLESKGGEYRPRVRAKVILPSLNEKLSFLLNDSEDQEEPELGDNDELISDEMPETSAAISYESDRYHGSKFSTRVGIRSSLKSFIVLKHSFPLYQDEKLIIRNFNYLFWREEEKAGANARFELDRIVDEDHFFRWTYSILRSETSKGNEWQNTFSWFNQLSDTSWGSYDLGVSGRTEQDFNVELYRLAFRYRKQLSIKWLFLEIEPEFLWVREQFNPREFKAGLFLRLDIEFGEH